jgi:nicotinate-nucleotide pyrophosphorylase (carboxylating)
VSERPNDVGFDAIGLDRLDVENLIAVALDEDLRYGPDATSKATTGPNQDATGLVRSRQCGVVCGVPVAVAVLTAVTIPLSGVTVICADGDAVNSGDTILELTGPVRSILLAERTMLNFLTHLSGVATITNLWVQAVAGTNCLIRDTRKTLPGLRQLEKYAVRCGGGTNHRMGLGDAALIKDNHIAAAGGVSRAIAAVRDSFPTLSIEVECDSLDQVLEALEAQCSLILLDNMDAETIALAVHAARQHPGVRIEASGGMSLDLARQIAQLGVDYIAVGAITHSAPALDIGLDFVNGPQTPIFQS